MNKGKLLYRLLVLLLVIIMLLSGSYVAGYIFDSVRQKNEYDALAAQVSALRQEAAGKKDTAPVSKPSVTPAAPDAPADPADSAQPTEAPVSGEPSVLPEYAPFYERNADLIGWMYIDGTNIDYPVMQTPDRVDYYLKRNFEKEASDHGCLYVRETCDVWEPSDNVTVYGHHMKDGTMFYDLKKYLKKEFWEENQTVNFDTLYEHHTYTIFSVFTTTATVGQGFKYHRFENAEDEAEFNEFVATCKKLSKYDTGITPIYGDKLICLSTCEYSQDNGRLVVVAVRN